MKFFLVGIKGSGMAALALYLKKSGFNVVGIDIENYVYTQDELIENNIEIYSLEYKILDYVDLVIIGHSFVGKNLEIINQAKKENIPIYEYHEFLNKIQDKYLESVAISGSHGKTTMTKLLQHCLNYENSVSSLVGDGTSCVETRKDYFVFEACEYQNHYLKYIPKDIIILNIDYDHNDYFKSFSEYQKSFIKFSDNALNNVFIHEDYNILNKNNVFTFGRNKESNFSAQNIELKDDGYIFDFYIKNQKIVNVKTKFYGDFMIDMCIAMLAYAYIHNFNIDEVVKRIPYFGGVKKRNQEIIINDDIYLIDYAHHPSQIVAMIKMCRNKYKDRKIVAVYKPDRYSRVQQFYKEIAQNLQLADLAYVDDFPSTSIKDIDGNIGIDDIIKIDEKRIKPFKEIKKNEINSNKYYVFLLMSSKDVLPILKKIEKLRL